MTGPWDSFSRPAGGENSWDSFSSLAPLQTADDIRSAVSRARTANMSGAERAQAFVETPEGQATVGRMREAEHRTPPPAPTLRSAEDVRRSVDQARFARDVHGSGMLSPEDRLTEGYAQMRANQNFWEIPLPVPEGVDPERAQRRIAEIQSHADTWPERLHKFGMRTADLFSETFNGLLMREAEYHQGPATYSAAGDQAYDSRGNQLYRTVQNEGHRLVLESREALDTPGRRAFEAAQADLQQNAYNYGSNADSYLTQTAESLVQMLPVLAAGIVTRGRSLEGEAEAAPGSLVGRLARGFGNEVVENRGSLGTLYEQQAGQQYGQSRAEGRDPTAAMIDANVFGLAEAIPEALPMSSLMRPGGHFLPRLLRTAGFEGASEMMTQAVEDAYSAGVIGQDMTWGQAWADIRDAGIIGSLMGGGMTAVEHPFHRPAEAPPADIREEAAAAPPDITPQDVASPLPTDLIAAGKKAADTALAETHADQLLNQNIGHGIGDKVSVTLGGQERTGTIRDAFTEEDPETGQHHGAVIDWEGAGQTRERLADLSESGARFHRAERPGERLAAAPAREIVRRHIAQAESGGNVNAANPRSTASGLFQILDSTFRHYYEQVYGRDPGEHPDRAVKDDPAVQNRLMDRMLDDYEHALRAHGHEVTAGNLYLNHFLGTGGANTILSNPNAPIESLVDSRVIRANPFLRGMTGADVAAWAARRMGGHLSPEQIAAGEAPTSEGPQPDFSWIDRPVDQAGAPAAETAATPAETIAEGDRGPAIGQESSTGLGEVGAGIAGGISSGLHDMLFDRFQRGLTTENGAPSTVLQVLARIRDNGGTVTRENLPEIGNAVASAPDTGPERQTALQGVVASFSRPAESTAASTEAAPQITVERSNVIIRDASEADRARVNAALPDNVTVLPRSDGALVAPAKYEDVIRSSLAAAEPTGDGTREAPITVTSEDHLRQAESQANQEPTPAQAAAMNYSHGHLRLHGLDIAIETPKGAMRRGVDSDGQPWENASPAAYGRIKRTTGGDGEQIDVYVGDHPQSDRAFVIDQYDPKTGKFDETKTVLGVNTRAEALAVYDGGFSDGSGPSRRRGVTEMPVEQFRQWIASDASAGPAANVPATPASAPPARETTPEATGQPAPETGIPAASESFDPAPHIAALKEYVSRRGRSLAPEAVARAIGVAPEHAMHVVSALAAQPNSGIYVSKAGNARRVPAREGPVSLYHFLKDRGGIRDDSGHALSNKGRELANGVQRGGRGLNRFPGLINNKTGMPLDSALEAAVEAGYFDTHERQNYSINDLQQKLENASAEFRPEDTGAVMDREAGKAQTDAEKTMQADIREQAVGLAFTPDDSDAALRYMHDGYSAAEAVHAAMLDAAGETLDTLEQESGVDPYAAMKEAIYAGSSAEDRGDYSRNPNAADRGAAAGITGPEGEQGNAGQGGDANAESNGAGAAGQSGEVATDPVEERQRLRVEAARERGRADFEAGKKSMPTSLGGGPEMMGWREGWTAARDAAKTPEAPAATDLLGQPAEQPAPKAEAPAESQPDMLGTQPGDERRALERKGEGRKQSEATQKAPGSEGGLFDSNARQSDIEQTPIDQAKAALQSALDALNGKAAEAPVAAPTIETIYRGESTTNRGGGYYSTDAEWARQFTQGGRAEEVKRAAISSDDVYVANPLPLATKEDQFDAAMEAAKAAGKKAFRVDEGTGEPNSIYVFDKKALRRAAPPEAQPEQPQYQRRLNEGDDPVFYSALERAVEASTTQRASSEQWAATLSKAAGVKREELEWSGIFDFLDMQKGPVSRDDLLRVIRDGGIKVEEVVLGEDPKSVFDVREIDGGHAVFRRSDNVQISRIFDDAEEADQAADDFSEAEGVTDTAFSTWSSDPNNPTYRELLITLPIAEGGNPTRAPATHWDQDAVVAHARFMEKTDAEGKRVLFVDEVQSDWHQKGRDEGYETKIPEPERLARDAAVTEAEKAEDEAHRTLAKTMAEAWQQKFDSFTIPAIRNEWAEATPQPVDEWSSKQLLETRFDSNYPHPTDAILAQSEALRTAMLRTNEAHQAASRATEGSIPNAPFKSSWPALVMKRIIRWASDHGFDKIAWTTGAEQAERYNLGAATAGIFVRKDTDIGKYWVKVGNPRAQQVIADQIGADRPGTGLAADGSVLMSSEQIKSLFGGAVGERVIARGDEQNGSGPSRLVPESNMDVGGAGMRQFYDRNLVNIANDLIKKHGGKVEPVAIPDAADLESLRKAEANVERYRSAEPFDDVQGRLAEAESIAARYRAKVEQFTGSNPGFTITPSLRDAAHSGFPLFQRAQNPPISETDAKAIVGELERTLTKLDPNNRFTFKAAKGLLDFLPADAQGAYLNRVAYVSLDRSHNPVSTIIHEIGGHGFRALGLYTNAEWTALGKDAKERGYMDWAKRHYPTQPTAKQEEEAISEMIATFVSRRNETKGFVRTALQKVGDFVDALINAIRTWRTGNPQARQIMRQIESGKIGARPAGFGLEGVPRASVGEESPSYQHTFENPETEKRWQEARKGVGAGEGVIAKTKAVWQAVANGFSRHWKHLPNEPRFSDLQQQLRKLENVPEVAKETAVRLLRNVVGTMTKPEYDLFARKVVLDDLEYEVARGHDLPFGLNSETLPAERARIDEQIAANPKLVEALETRRLQNKVITDELVAEGVLSRDQVANPAYFRHMVLDYARAERNFARGAGSKISSPWWAKRAGSNLDINANFLEAEADWMLKAMVDVQTAKAIRFIKESDHNIRDSLRDQARASNSEKLGVIMAANPDLAEQETLFRQRIAMGLETVRKAVESASPEIPPLIVPAHLRKAAESLTSKSPRDESIFPLLAWMLDNNKPGAEGAAMALKAISQRKSWAKSLLGEKYVNPDDVKALAKRFAPDGHVAWQPREGRHLFTAKTVPEHVLDRLINSLADQQLPGIPRAEMELALQAIKPQLVVGGDRYTMVIPKEVADTLDEFGDAHAENVFGRAFAAVQGAWKQWTLINFRRFFKYNLNNAIGDFDAVIAGHPATLLKMGRATNEIWNVMVKGAAPSQEYQDAFERGVFTSGLTFQEIPDINKLSALKHLTDERSNRPDKLILNAAGSVWRALQGATNFRETLMRYAAYLSYLEKMNAGQSMEKIGYGASLKNMVDAVGDPRDRAALMARDLLGDYGSISVVGAFLRKYIIPFWSWKEINTKRYWRLTGNAFRESKAKGVAVGGALGASIAVRTAVGLTIRMAMVYGLIQLWNHLLFGDDEDRLSEQQRRQLHLLLGRDSDGNIISLKMQGALSDVLGELGFPDAVAGIRRAEAGQGTYGQAAVDTLKAPINTSLTSITPIIGEPLEQAMNIEPWPDLFAARPIRDRWRHLFSAFSLENEYDVVADRPSRGYAHSWADAFVYRHDPGEMAYNDIRGMTYDFMERTTGESGSTNRNSPRSSALRDYRMALRYGDQARAQEALQEYRRYDGTSRGLHASIARADPLGAIPRRLRAAFLATLTDDQRVSLQDAEEWYREQYLRHRQGER